MDSLIGYCQRIKAFFVNAFSSLLKLFAKPKNGSFRGAGAIDKNARRQSDLDKKLVYSLSKSRIPSARQFKYLKKFLTPGELWLIRISAIVIICSAVFLGARFYITHLQTVPVDGGVYTEGLVGFPKYINPLYAGASDVDSDLSLLVYSSLFKRGKNGELAQDLVDNYSMGEDGKTYALDIKQGVKWHDGSDLTVDDIIFTFNAIQDKQFNSPLRASFTGVNIEKTGDWSIKFILTDPYAAFLELLTFGILPSNIWMQISPDTAALADLNLKPIGSGAYKFDKLIKNEAGIIREYQLVANEDYYGNKPKIDLNFKFFSTVEEAVNALNTGSLGGISYLPSSLKTEITTPKTMNFYKLYMPQLTAVFFNTAANPALADKAVRQALAHAIDKNDIINNVISGDAYAVDGPILPNSFAYFQDIKKYEKNSEEAGRLLDSVDWKLAEITDEDVANSQANIDASETPSAQDQTIVYLGSGKWRKKGDAYLIIRLAAVDRGENGQVVAEIKKYWEELGVKTALDIKPANLMQAEVIKPRKFDALFYGEVLGADPDPYAFWHSSQASESGFNIANFSNKEVDQLLEDARLTSDTAMRQEKYKRFQEIIAEEVPAVFLYSPVYIYIQTKEVQGFDVQGILIPHDRFANIDEWYLKTGKRLVW